MPTTHTARRPSVRPSRTATSRTVSAWEPPVPDVGSGHLDGEDVPRLDGELPVTGNASANADVLDERCPPGNASDVVCPVGGDNTTGVGNG